VYVGASDVALLQKPFAVLALRLAQASRRQSIGVQGDDAQRGRRAELQQVPFLVVRRRADMNMMIETRRRSVGRSQPRSVDL